MPELLIVLTITGILGAVATVRVRDMRDRIAVRSATNETVSTFAAARRWALSRASRTAVAIDTGRGVLTIRSFNDTIVQRRVGELHGVAMAATRDSMAYAPNGLGYGASNLSVFLRRGTRAETVVVSRLGRVRR